MLDVFDVANYFLSLCEDYVGEGITNLKLQKLCYYAQGIYLADHGKRLFDSDIEAWMYGPVVRELYESIEEYGNNPVEYPINGKYISLDQFTKDEKDIMDDVYMDYGSYACWKLRNMTCAEPPWVKATTKNGPSTPSKKVLIADNDMQRYFSMA